MEWTLESAVTDWVIDHPEVRVILEEWGIDYSCSGKSLGYACEQRGVDPEMVLSALRARVAGGDEVMR